MNAPSGAAAPPAPPDAEQAGPRRSTSALLRRVVGRILAVPKPLLATTALGLVVAGIRYLRAWLAGPLLDDVALPVLNEQKDWTAVEGIASELLLVLGLSVVVQPLAVYFRSVTSQRVIAEFRRTLDREVAQKLLAAPLRLHRRGTSGDFLARSLTDAQLTSQIVLHLVNELLISGQLVLIGVFTLFVTSWQLTLLTLLGLPLVFGAVAVFGTRVQKQAKRRQETQGDLSQRLVSILSGIKVIKAFQGQEIEESAYAVQAGKFFRRHMKVVWNSVFARAVGEFVNPAIAVGVLGFGLWLLVEDRWGMTLGTLTQFALTLGVLYKPLKRWFQSVPKILESSAGADRLFHVLDLEAERADRDGARRLEGLSHHIAFRDVCFDYDGAPVLRGLDLEIAPGEVVAVVGRTGAGKSTLVDLVLRFHDPTSGAIEIDGVDLRDYARDSFLDRVAVVTQEPFLFDLSVAENIRYGRREATDEEVRAAARAASADAFVQSLPQGYDTTVGEFGLRLSGGQRQRLTIARAIVADPAVLVFDEATSALDAATESAVQQAINDLRGERTIFLVAHRLSTIRHADRILVLDEGRIVQAGRHETLVAEPGLYRELVGANAA